MRHLGKNEQQLISCRQRFISLSRLLEDQGDRWILMMKLGCIRSPRLWGRHQGILVIFRDWRIHDFDNHLVSSKVVATEVTTYQWSLFVSIQCGHQTHRWRVDIMYHALEAISKFTSSDLDSNRNPLSITQLSGLQSVASSILLCASLHHNGY